MDINPLIEDSNTDEGNHKETRSNNPMSQMSQSTLGENQTQSNKKPINSSTKYESPHKEILKTNQIKDQVQRLRINYDDIDQFEEKSNKNQLNVYNLRDNNERKKLDSQLKKYNQNANSSENKIRFANYLDSTQKSEDVSKSLQYKVPINSVKKDQIHSSREGITKNAPRNVFSIRKHEVKDSQQFEEFERPRDRTPNAKTTQDFDKQSKPEAYASKAKKDKERSRKRTQSSIKKNSKQRKRTPKKYKHNFRPVNDSMSSKKSSRKSNSIKNKGSKKKQRKEVYYDSQDEYDKAKDRSRRKSKLRYESSTSEEKEPRKKIIIESHKSKQNKRNKSSNRRYDEDEQFESNYKIDKRERKSRDRQAKASYEDEPQSNKKTKTTLFQVDINMDSKIVRISIHEGDNIDKIVQKFNDIFHLKTKQLQLLTHRLKAQYEEMTTKNYESYD